MALPGMIAMAEEAPSDPMREAPTQYYEALTNLITRLRPNTRKTRTEVYDRVRELLVLEAQQADPPWELLEVVQEQRALEEAIKEIEADYEFDENRRRPPAPKAEDWAELERSLPNDVRQRQDPRAARMRQGGQRILETNRRPKRDLEERGRGRYRESRWRMPDLRPLILIGVGFAVLVAAYFSIAAIFGLYPFSTASTPTPPQQEAKTEAPVPPALRITPQEWVERGNDASKAGNYDDAIEAYGNAIRGGQRTVSVYNNRAYAFWVKGETNRAIADYDEALRIDANNIVALANRAVAYNFRGDYELAIKDLDQALKLEPNNPDVWNSRCWGRALAEQLKEALADCAEALRLRPNDANTYDSRGFVYLKMGQNARAISDYDQAIKLNPRLAGALYGRGIAKQRSGDRNGSTDIAAAKAMKPEIEAIFSRYGVR